MQAAFSARHFQLRINKLQLFITETQRHRGFSLWLRIKTFAQERDHPDSFPSVRELPHHPVGDFSSAGFFVCFFQNGKVPATTTWFRMVCYGTVGFASLHPRLGSDYRYAVSSGI